MKPVDDSRSFRADALALMARATFMESQEPTLAVSIEQRPDGSIRVGGTRTLFATAVTAYLQGESREEIAENCGQTPLDQVYAGLAFYLAHRKKVDAYLPATKAEAEVLRAQIEREFPVTASCERLREQLDERRAAGTR